MTNPVDGVGWCSNPAPGDDGDFRHEWRYATMYQVNPPPPKITGAPPEPSRVYARYYCVHCLDERDKEVPQPVHVPLVINNVISLPQGGLRVQ